MYDLLITGATGFIGKNFIKSQKNKKIIIIARKKQKSLNFNKNKFTQIIINKSNELQKKLKHCKVKTIIHFATHYRKIHSKKDINKIYEANILLGENLLKLCKNMGVKKFINISTRWELLKNAKKYNINKAYLNSKKKFSGFLIKYSKTYPSIRFITLFLEDTFGQDDNRKKILPTIKKNLKKNKLSKITNKKLRVNLLNTLDINKALNIVIKKKMSKNEKYLINNKKYFLVKRIIEKFNNQTKQKIHFKYLNKNSQNFIYKKCKRLPNWKIRYSSLANIVSYIRN